MVNKKRLNKTTFLSFLITFVILFSCNNTSTDIQSPIVPEKQSLETILERGKLIAVTDLNSTSYFVYRGEPRGYQFDLLHSFAEYLLPTAADVPDIETILIESGSGIGPYGAKGVGEPSGNAMAPAITNAICDAVGARVTQLPATAERVLFTMLSQD